MKRRTVSRHAGGARLATSIAASVSFVASPPASHLIKEINLEADVRQGEGDDRMAAEKGLYRSIYSAIWEDPEFQAFDPDMMVVFFSLRTCRECNFPCIYSFYKPLLYERLPKMPPERIDAAFDRLVDAGWIQYDRPVLWIVKGFKNEPSRVPKNQKQIDGVQNILNSLAKVGTVARFRAFYRFPAPPPDEGPHAGIHEGIDAGMDEGMAGASKQRTGTGTGKKERSGSGSALPPLGQEAQADRAPGEEETKKAMKAMSEHLARKHDPNNGGGEGKEQLNNYLATLNQEERTAFLGVYNRATISKVKPDVDDDIIRLQARGFSDDKIRGAEEVLATALASRMTRV